MEIKKIFFNKFFIGSKILNFKHVGLSILVLFLLLAAEESYSVSSGEITGIITHDKFVSYGKLSLAHSSGECGELSLPYETNLS